MHQRLMLLLLEKGYVHGQSWLAQQLGVRLLRRHLRATTPHEERARLRAVLLELHAAHEKNIRSDVSQVPP